MNREGLLQNHCKWLRKPKEVKLFCLQSVYCNANIYPFEEDI